MNVLVVTPTYNEKDNLPLLVDGVLKHDGFRCVCCLRVGQSAVLVSRHGHVFAGYNASRCTRRHISRRQRGARCRAS